MISRIYLWVSMAGMAKWPKSKSAQAGIAFLSSAVSTPLVFMWVMRTRMELYVREYPHDGQDSLSAFSDALFASMFTLVGVFAAVFAIQRFLTTKSDSLV